MKPNLADFKAIVFDLFHTLTSVEPTKAPGKATSEILGISREKWNDQLLKYSHERLRGKNKDQFEIIRKMAHAINPDIPEHLIEEAAKTRAARFEYSLVNIDSAIVETLRRLKAMTKLIGLISNADANEVAGWKSSPIREYFDSVVFSCDVGYIKPEREVYEYCLKELKIAPEQSLFVGDGGSDELKGAKEIGMTTVLATHAIKQIWPEKIVERREYADYEIDQISELVE